MLKFSRKVLSELEEELNTIFFDYDNPIIMCEKSIETVLTPIKQEYYSKFRLLIMRLIFSSLLGVYQSSIFP
jgi:hypothetical protein